MLACQQRHDFSLHNFKQPKSTARRFLVAWGIGLEAFHSKLYANQKGHTAREKGVGGKRCSEKVREKIYKEKIEHGN